MLNLNLNLATPSPAPSDIAITYTRRFPKDPGASHSATCRCRAYCNLPRLPMEIWFMILKFKKRLDCREILEIHLKNPDRMHAHVWRTISTLQSGFNWYVEYYKIFNVEYYYCTWSYPDSYGDDGISGNLIKSDCYEIIEDELELDRPDIDGSWIGYFPREYWVYNWDSIRFYFNKVR